MPTAREIVDHRFAEVRIGAVAGIEAGVEAVGEAGFGKQLRALFRIVNRRRRLPEELEILRERAAGEVRKAECQRLVDRLAVDAQDWRPAGHARRATATSDPIAPGNTSSTAPNRPAPSRSGRACAELLRRVRRGSTGDIDLAALQRRQAGRLVRDHPHDDALHRWASCASTARCASSTSSTPGVKETNLYGPAPIGAFLNPSSPTFSTYFFGTIQPAPVALG